MPVHVNTVINMKPFHILLSDAHRIALDAYRAKLGLKSDAAAIRYWLESLSK